MTNFRVSELWRYPVKSMQGQSLEVASVSTGGIRHDRCWAVRDEETKTIRGAKHIAGLLQCSAAVIEGSEVEEFPDISHIQISFPEGKTISSEDPNVHRVLSDFLGQEVTLWPRLPASDDSHYAINAEADGSQLDEWRRNFGLEEGEPFPDMSEFPAAMLTELTRFATPRGTYFDAYPINILTEASIRKFSTLGGFDHLHTRRFRPNIVLEDDEERSELIEDGWIGQHLAIGTAAFDVAVRTVRCVMVTRAQPGLPRASSIMRTLVRETSQCLSVYANVAKEGRVRLGDQIVGTGLQGEGDLS